MRLSIINTAPQIWYGHHHSESSRYRVWKTYLKITSRGKKNYQRGYGSAFQYNSMKIPWLRSRRAREKRDRCWSCWLSILQIYVYWDPYFLRFFFFHWYSIYAPVWGWLVSHFLLESTMQRLFSLSSVSLIILSPPVNFHQHKNIQ